MTANEKTAQAMANREWIFPGSISLNNVQFYVRAASKEEAIEKARAGDYEFYETQSAETVNWLLDPYSGEENA